MAYGSIAQQCQMDPSQHSAFFTHAGRLPVRSFSRTLQLYFRASLLQSVCDKSVLDVGRTGTMPCIPLDQV